MPLSWPYLIILVMDVKISDPENWVEQYADFLYAYTLKFIPNSDTAQNLVQETFLAALRSRDSFRGRSAEKTWLAGILRHKIMDYFKRRYREIPAGDFAAASDESMEQFFDRATGHLKKTPLEWQLNAAALLDKKEFWEAFHHCLGRLSEKTAAVFSLRELQGCKTPEICKLLGISKTHLWVMLHRARLQLRECLERNWFGKDAS